MSAKRKGKRETKLESPTQYKVVDPISLMITIEHINKEDEPAEPKKTDDKSGQEKEIDVEEQEEVDIEGHGKTTD